MIKRALIPLAGFGTRLFPETKIIKKGFLPVIDYDGLMKPALLVLLEQLMNAGINEVGLIIGEDERDDYGALFSDTPDELMRKLPADKQAYAKKLSQMRENISYIYQKERLGFGHAVFQGREFTKGEPVLLLLGDILYKSYTDVNCCKQIMDAYMKCGKTMIGLNEVPVHRTKHYGTLAGEWADEEERVMRVTSMVEKPSQEQAEKSLGVLRSDGNKHYYVTFGQYILAPSVFDVLEKNIRDGKLSGGEIQLTDALETVRESDGLFGLRIEGESFDIGLPETYRRTVAEF